jgi:osmotically-inducible protein OsmY
VSLTLSAAAGLGTGIVAGVLMGGLMGAVHPERLRRAMGRMRRRAVPQDPHVVERAVRQALRDSALTRNLEIRVHALGDGLVELTGTAPTAAARREAGEAARTVPGADVVVNRILVEGSDLPAWHPAPPSGR